MAPPVCPTAVVNVVLNNHTYTATASGNTWSTSGAGKSVIPLNLANGNYTVTVSGTDANGNSGSGQGQLLVDKVLPQVIINTFAGDNAVNAAEVVANQTLSGRVVGGRAGR